MSNGRRHITPTSRIGRHIAAVAITLIALTACHYLPPLGGIRGGLSGRLGGGIDSLVNSRPDSALTLLNSIARDTAKMSRRDLMRYYLLRTNAENKCDTVLTARHAALMRRVCDYYDRHSFKREANNRMLAHYLLGRCYDDMGEAPLALEEFHNAENAADTTDIDCDFHQLSLIHSQCGSIYSSLYMLRQDLEELKKAAYYAKLCNDTISYLTYEDLIANVYGNLGIHDSLISIKQELSSQFKQMGRKDLSAISTGSCAYAFIQKGKLKEAKKCMDEYEKESGMFFANGDIRPGHEIYYFTKGVFYMAVDRLDSAELFFRKNLALSRNSNARISAMQGLSDLYRKKNNNDSVAKYSTLCYELNDSVYKESEVKVLLSLKASFDYSRLQKSEAKKQEQLEKEQQRKRVLLLIAIVIILLSSFIIQKIWKNRRLRIDELNEQLLQYAHDKQDLQEKTKEMEVLRLAVGNLKRESLRLKKQSDNLRKDREATSKENRDLAHKNKESLLHADALQKIIDKNELVIENLTKKILQYEADNPLFKVRSSSLNSLANSDAFIPFAEYLRNRKVIPSIKDWNCLLEKVQDEMPGFKTFLLDRNRLKMEDYKLCVLVMLNCSPSDICSILNMHFPHVSKTRKKLLREVFNKDGKPEEFDETLRTIF